MPTPEAQERRREERLGFAIELRVHGFNADGTRWDEATATKDISARGLSYVGERAPFVGQLLHLSLPMPRGLRQHDLTEPLYETYALVRDVSSDEGERWRINLMFFGKSPPRGFHEAPHARYALPSDVPPTGLGGEKSPPAQRPARPQTPPSNGQRRFQRYDVFAEVLLQEFDEWGAILTEELTVTENIGKGGARVRTARPFKTGEVVFLRESRGSFVTRAAVRNASLGGDRIRRLNLEFLDAVPDHLVPRD